MPDHEAKLAALEKAGHPVIRIEQNSTANIGQEFFRFEIATAIAGAVIGINPFDQPDVEASKVKTRELTAAYEKTGALPAETPVCSDESIALYTDAANADALRKAGADGGVESWLRAHLCPHRLRRLCRDARLSRPRRRQHRALADAAARTCATAAMSRPASNSGRAFCIRPARPIKAAPTAACFCRSPRTTPRICRFPATAPASASSKRRRRAAISTFWPSAAAARCACISRAMSDSGLAALGAADRTRDARERSKSHADRRHRSRAHGRQYHAAA